MSGRRRGGGWGWNQSNSAILPTNYYFACNGNVLIYRKTNWWKESWCLAQLHSTSFLLSNDTCRFQSEHSSVCCNYSKKWQTHMSMPGLLWRLQGGHCWSSPESHSEFLRQIRRVWSVQQGSWCNEMRNASHMHKTRLCSFLSRNGFVFTAGNEVAKTHTLKNITKSETPLQLLFPLFRSSRTAIIWRAQIHCAKTYTGSNKRFPPVWSHWSKREMRPGQQHALFQTLSELMDDWKSTFLC